MRLSVLATLAACSASSPNPSNPKASLTEVAVELASVTLADECGESAQPPPPPEKQARSKPEAEGRQASVACADPKNCQGPMRLMCEQTSMQLSIRSPAGAKPTTIRIAKVELLDPSGKVVEVLTARNPSRWVNDTYVPWDGAIAASQELNASYMLSAPNWDKLADGKSDGREKLFALRVTVSDGNSEKTVVRQSVEPVSIKAPVET